MSIPAKERKKLWALSGNQCAYPNCNMELVYQAPETGEHSIVGEECHIVSLKESEPRGNSPLTKEERSKYDNLILLCNVHHKIVDDLYDIYTVTKLHEMKKLHEERVRKSRTHTNTPFSSTVNLKKMMGSIPTKMVAIILPIVLLAFISKYVYSLNAGFQDKINRILEIIFAGRLGISLFAIFYGTFFALLKASDNHFKRKYEEESRPKRRRYVSSATYPITTMIDEKPEPMNNLRVTRRTITLKNGTPHDIAFASGRVVIYSHDIIVGEYRYNIKKLKTGKGIVISDHLIHPTEWNEFSTEVDEIQFGEHSLQNVDLFGTHLIKTHYLILNYFNYIRFYRIRLPYEITWLKKYCWRSYVKPWLGSLPFILRAILIFIVSASFVYSIASIATVMFDIMKVVLNISMKTHEGEGRLLFCVFLCSSSRLK